MDRATSNASLPDQSQRRPEVHEIGADLTHRRMYVSRLVDNATGFNGNSWIVMSVPSLSFSPVTFDGLPETVIATGGKPDEAYFRRTSRGYTPLFGAPLRLAAVGDEWIMRNGAGIEWRFFGFDCGKFAGNVKYWRGIAGEITLASYDSRNRLIRLEQTRLGEDGRASLEYRYFDEGAHQDRLAEVQKFFCWSELKSSVWRIRFSYHLARHGHGARNDLRTVEVQDFDGRKKSWSPPRITYYRYYLSDHRPGFEHGLKFVLEPDGYQRLRRTGHDPLVAPDELIAEHAARSFEYDYQRRIAKAAYDGGSRVHRFEHVDSDRAPGRNWCRRTRETFEGGSHVTYYNDLNLPVLRAKRSPEGTVIETYTYTRTGSLIRGLDSASIAAVYEPETRSQNFKVFPRSRRRRK